MPKYVVDGQVYDIGDADVKSFEQAYPNAMQKYVVGEKKYNVPLGKREKFLGEFKDAVAMGLEGGGSAAGKVEAAGLDDAAASQADASASAVADAGKAKPFVDMSADPYVFAQMGAPYHYGASNKAELDKAIAKEEAEKAAKAARRAQWDAEDSEISKTYAPARPSSADEVMANYRGMFDLTEDGKRLNASIDKRIKDLQDAYFQEYQGTKSYKDIVKAQEDLGKRLKDGFWKKYGERYKADMEQAYGGMQGMTQAEVERAIKKRGKELQDAYFKEYQGTEEYKAIAREQDALEKRLNDEFGAAYNGRLNDEMEGDYGKYNAALMERYGDRINAESKPFVTADYDKELIGRMGRTDDLIESNNRNLNTWYAVYGDAVSPSLINMMSMPDNANSYWMQEKSMLERNHAYLEHAKRLDKKSKNILDEARRKGNTNFFRGLARGFGQNITWRDFTFGLAELENSARLKSVIRKAEEDPSSLTKEETMLLDALTDNMAITAYYSDDLGKGYKAGQTTAVSIPFMLEMMANPIAGSGKAMAKSLLKYGLRKYGVSLAKKRALKMGTRILTDAAAATGMTLTTGAAGVAADANNRIVQDYDISKGEDGTYRVKRKGEVSDADAWTKAFLTRTLENQSEMFFNAFDGGWSVVADLFKPASSRVANTAAGKWAKEMIAAAGRTDIGQFVRGAIKNPTMRGLAERANFHGIGGEYLEEVYNNLVSIPLGETTWEEATDFDNNLETFIGLAPTSFVFGMFGAGGYMRDRYRINKQLSGMYDAADEQQRKMMTSIREAVLSGDRDGLKIQLGRILGSDLPAEVKRSMLDYTYNSQMAEAMDAADQVSADDRAQEARAQVESVADLANGAVVTVDRIHADGSTEAGHVVGWMDGSPMWIPDSDPSAQPVALRADEYDQGQMTSVPLEEARTQAADDAYRQESERVERETRYSPDITPYVSLVPGDSFADADGNTYTVAMRGAGGTVVFDREDPSGGLTSVQLDEQSYMDLRQGGIDAAEAASHGSGPIIIGGGYRPAGANASNEAAPGSDNQTDNRTDGQEAGDSNMSGQDADVQSDETKNVPAMQRIPKDEQGNPLYEQTDSDTAWDAIVEQTDGDEVMAQTVADGMVADKEAALKKLEKSKSKGGVTVAEKIASEKERKAAIEAAQQELNIWKKIAGTANRRRTDAEAERRRVAETKAALRKEEEERLRAEREEAEGTADGERIKAESVQQDGTPPAVGVGSENTGRSERNDGSNVKGKNNIQTTEILTGEKKDLQERILGWLTDENIEWAEGKDINEVIEHFGNTPEPIAVMPPIVRKNVPSLDGDYLYCGKAYMIDHHANHHPELDIDEYINIQTILDNYDDIKDLSDDGKLKIAFVKKLDKCYAVVAELSKENDKIVLHKTFFYRDAAGKRVPYKNKPSILERWSVDGSTTISPAEVQQPADTENISALDQSISVSKDSENPSINQAKGGKVAENQNRSAVQDALAAAEQETNTEPTEAQKEAGNYKKGHFKIDGYDVTIEIPKGSVRRGTDASGKQWEHEMHNTYGYIRGTEGVDGDHIDVFFSEDPSQGDVFVVDQVNKDGSFDEHKVMYGFPDIESARKAYLSNYEDGWQGLGAITPVSKEEFKKWIDSSHRKTKPFAEYSSVKPLGDMLLGEQPNKPTVKPKMAGGRRKAKGAQRKRMRMMESLARKLGYGIVWHDTMDENGLFEPETRTIHIALDAEVPLAAVFGHETMHKIAENREDYESVRDLARNVLGKEEFRRRVDECERRYRDAGYDKPRGYYEEEAVCDFMGEMLYNAGLLERVCWDANHRVLAAIRDVIDRIMAALDLLDENMMRIRLTVSAAYKRAIERAKVEDAGSASGERRFSLLRKEEVDARSAEYHAKHDTGVTQEVYDAAQRAMDSMYGMMLPYYDATALGRRMLPEERYGGKDAKSTIFENGSYGKTMENTLKCIRTLAYNEFTDDVKRVLGRPLTQKESFLASQMVYDIAADPQCLYCYVSLDRKAYDEFLLRYMQQRDEVLDKFRAMGEKGRDIGDAAPHQALSDLYGEYLSGRKDTKEQRSRFDMWIRNEMDGVRAVGGADLATADVRSAVLSGLDESMARQVRDAEKYAQSASWAKKDVDYISYIGELLRLSPAWIKKLTGEYGLRFYSFSEYTPAFLLENMQMVRDAALRGLRGLGYTKEVDFVKVFAPTGMNINCSCYGRLDGEGRMQMDTLQGADWDEVKALREKYGNVGAVFVATNDAGVEWALGQEWIDVVIPFHIVRTGQDIADFYGWSNYSREQADSVVGGSRKMYISPVEHKNDKGAFLEACKRHGVVPRFSKWLDNPNYMKLVNETRLSVDESADLKPVFDMDAAKDSWERFVNRGGYYNGWWNVDAQGYADAVRTVVEDIRSGKMASDAEYGNQRMPVNPEKMIAAARKKRIHGNVPLVDVYDRSGNVLPSGGKRASVRKQKGAASGRELTDGERALRDALVDRLRGAGIEVIADAEEGQRVLDAENANGEKLRKQKVYHGSGADFEAFDHSHMGEGEGAQAYGWGTYVTEVEGIGRTYAKANNNSLRRSKLESDIRRLKESLPFRTGDARREGEEEMKRLEEELSKFEDWNSVLYTIEIPDDNGDNYLQFNKPVGNKRAKAVTEALYEHIVKNDEEELYADDVSIKELKKELASVTGGTSGGDLYGTISIYLGSDEAASKFLDGMGIIGVKYPSNFYKGGNAEGKSNYVIFNEANLKITDKVRFFRTADGQAYGFTVNGKIYIDPRIATAETPIHEYAHLWASAMREVNPEEWRNIVGLMKGTGVWDEVKRTYPELKTEDEIADEVLAQYSGRRGAERLRAERDAAMAKADGVMGKASVADAFERVRKALRAFWRKVCDLLNVRFTSAEEVADRVLADLLDGVNPVEAGKAEGRRTRMQEDEEIKDIVAKAKADGTYMKAPNGKPSRLSPRQWAQVRTKAFKRWFGDWEFAEILNMIDKIKPISVTNNPTISKKDAEAIFERLENGKNKYDGREITWVKNTVGKILRNKGFDASKLVPIIKEVFDNSVHIISENEIIKDGHKKHSNFIGYHHYVGKIEDNGKEYYVRFTVQELNTRKKDFVPNQLHSTFISDIEIMSANTRVNTGKSPATTNISTHVDAKLQTFFETASKAYENCSKVVDENGEPLVVYHGTQEEFSVFENYVAANMYGETFSDGYMFSDESSASNYGEPMALFLNIRNLEDYRDKGKLLDVVERYFDDFNNQTDEFYFESAEDAVSAFSEIITEDGRLYHDEGRIELEQAEAMWHVLQNKLKSLAEESGFDGFVINDSTRGDEHVSYCAFSPTQIKSATDNVGTFDGSNPDIRYQFVGVSEPDAKEFDSDGKSVRDGGMRNRKGMHDDAISEIKQKVIDLFEKAYTGEFKGKPQSICKLSRKGKEYLEKLSGLHFKESVDFVVNPSDMNHIRADHYGKNEKDSGNNIPLTDEDLMNMVDILNRPDAILYGIDKNDGRKLFFFFKDAGNGLYNLSEVCSTKRGNLTAKSFFKSKKKGINQRVMEIKQSLLPTSVTYSGESLSSDANMINLLENAKVSGENSEIDSRKADETAGGKAMLRRGGVPGSVMTAAERRRLGDAALGFASGIGLGEVDVYDRIEDVPGYDGMDERQRRAKGWFDPATGRVAVVAGNHVDAADIQQTVLHEAVAHKGLRELLGDRFDGFLDGVLKNADEGVRAGITDLAKENGWDFRRATEEYLAGLAEDGRFADAGAGWWKRVKRMFVEMLRAAGFGGRRISDGDLRYVLWRSLSHMKGDTGVIGMAEDVLMQYRLSVGNYGADVTRGAYVGGPLMAAGGAYSESVNRRFNEELERQMNGTLDKGHIYQLGVPSSILRSTGIPGLPIQMSASRLEEKATRYGHDFSLDEIKDLVNALQHPLAVFEYGDKKKAQNIIVEIQKDGKNFVVGLSIRPTVNGRVLEINSIRNVFPKNNAEWLNWISQGKSIYLDKEKIQALIAQQRTILADVDYLDLDSVAKIVENFENPSVGGGILYRDGDVSDGTREAYDAAVNQGRKGTLRLTRYNFREAFQDELLSLKLLQDIVEKKYGVELRGFEDAYLAENRLASMNEKDRKRFLDMFYEPMMEEVDRLIGDGASQEEINRYIMAKSGLERNREFAVRDYFRDLEKEAREMDDETARQAALDKIRQDRDAYDSERDRIRQEVRNGTKSWLDAHDELMALAERTVGDTLVRDYSGLSGMFGENDFERAAADFVLSFESGHETDEVWKRIRATNDETLRKCMESGMIDGAARARIGGMFDYYVPLRGFDDKTVDDVYAYVGIEGDGGAGKVMAKAKGRTTVAKDPLAVMAVMGERAILQGNRNWVKQHLLNMALNRPTDVCRAGRMWYVYDPVEQVWKESYPAIPDDATPEEADDVITQWEEDMRIASNTEITVKDKNGNDVKVKGATQRKEDLNVDYIVPPGSRFRSEHAVRVMRGGKEYVVFVHGNPRAAQAVNGLLKHGADGLMLVYHNLKRMYSSALTQYNVNFAGANIARDVQHSLFITLVNSGVKEAVRLAGYIPRVAPALARYIAGRPKAGSRVDAYVREFMENGGETGYAIAQSVDTWIADNASRTKRVGKGRRAARFAYDMTIGKMADWFSVANRMLEGNTRLAAYVASREGGDSVERAVKKAKDITVNFNKKGSGHTPGGWGQLANFYRNWFMFANPIIQGTFQFYDSMKMHPWRFAGMASTFLTAGMLVPMLNQALVAAFGGDDDDYYNLNEYTRRSNLMLFTGDGYVKIPLPQTLRNLYALGDIVMGVFNGRTDADDALPEMWNELCGMLSLEQLKVGGGLKGFGHNLLGGSMFAPVSDVVFNEKFNGMPIYKENVFGGRRAEYLNVYGGTWSFLVDASRLLNDATNGDYLFARSPYVGQMLNPAVLQHLLTNYTGGIGQAVGDVSSLASDLIGGELSDNFSWRTVPVAKRFYQDMDEITVNSAYKRRFDGIASKLKDLDEEIKETKRRIKDGDRSLYDHLNRLERTEDYGRLRRMKRYQGKIRRAKSPEDVAKIRRMAVDEFEMKADGRRR